MYYKPCFEIRPSHRLFICYVSLIYLLHCTPSPVWASETQDHWKVWAGTDPQLCEIRPDRCHCGGYFEQTDLTPYPADVDPANFFGIANAYRYTFDGQAELYGDILMRLDTLEIKSDKVTIDQKENTADFKGQVEIHYPDLLVGGPSANFDLDTHEAELEDAHFVIYPASIHGNADTIKLTGKDKENQEVRFIKGNLTTCAPTEKKADWQILGEEINLDLDSGWGTIKHMRLKIGNIPLMYMPYFRFPIDDRRQSGFLYPSLDFSTPDIALPYYLNLAPNYDATLTPRYIGDHGNMIETEFRYLFDQTQGELLFSYLGDDEALNTDRKQASLTQSSRINQDWSSKLDISYVSDNQYFNDFGNSLAQSSASHLKRSFLLEGLRGPWALQTRFESFQTIDSAIDPKDRPYRRLPEIKLKHNSEPFGQQSWEWINEFNYTYFAQPEALLPFAHRSLWNTTFKYPNDWIWGYANAQLSLHQRTYHISGESKNLDQSYSIPVSSLDTGMFLERTYSTSENRWFHTLEPRLFFAYIPVRAEQNALPNFDSTEPTEDYNQLFRANRFTGHDRIGDAQQISLGITQRLINADSGEERITFQVGQAFYLKDRQVSLEANEAFDTRGRSALVAEFKFEANKNVRLQTQVNWNEAQNHLDSLRTTLTVRPQGTATSNNLFNLSYIYRNPLESSTDKSHQSQISFVKDINRRWSLLSKIHHDYEQHRALEQITGLTYESCCWQTTIAYHKKLSTNEDNPSVLAENQYAFLIEFQLKGIAGIGGGLGDFLEDQIQGYRRRN